MGESSNSEQTLPVHPVHHGLIWFSNVLVTGLALLFFFETDTATKEFYEVDGLIFFAIPALIATVFIAGVGTIVFILTVKVLGKGKRSPRASQIWLGGPAWVFALAVAAYALWNLTPQQRLKKVCWGASVPARNIKVAGCAGMQMSEWLAVFKIQPGDFQGLVSKQQLQPDSPENFADKLNNHTAMIKRSALFMNLAATTNSQCFKREVTGVDGNIHGGIYAAYDSKTACAVVFHDGY